MSNQDAVIRLIIAGEHSIFRHGLRRLLEAEAGFCIVREIADGAAAVPLVSELTPDVLLLGLTDSKHPPIETLKSLASCPTTRTIVLTDRLDRAEVLSAVQLGVRAVVLKDSPPDVLFKSIRAVMAGEYWLGHEWFSAVVPNLKKVEAARRRTKAFGLTRREIEIVRSVSPAIPTKRSLDNRPSPKTPSSLISPTFSTSWGPRTASSSPSLPLITGFSTACRTNTLSRDGSRDKSVTDVL